MQVVVTPPVLVLPGVQEETGPSATAGPGEHVVMTQLVSAPPPAVQAATTGPVVTVRHDTYVGPVVLPVQEATGLSVSRKSEHVVKVAPLHPGVQALANTAVLGVVTGLVQVVVCHPLPDVGAMSTQLALSVMAELLGVQTF